jgi:hypothetical protein
MGGMAPTALRKLDIQAAERLAKSLKIDITPLSGQEAGQRDVFGTLADNTIRSGSDVLFYNVDEATSTVAEVHAPMGAPAVAVGPYTYSMFSDLLERHTNMEERLSKCERELANFRVNRPVSPAQPAPQKEEK